jgi:peptidoglycan/LPS O-acetylase OafA/YrhL
MADTAPSETASDVRPAFGGYLRGTEGIRGFFCSLIVFYHCYLYTAPAGAPSRGWPYTYVISRAQLGLSIFFMLSAFLLYRPFVQSVLRGRPRPSFGAYLANRVLRIFPVYWVILIAAALAGATIVWIPHHDIAFHLPTFIANLFLVHGLHPSGIQTGVPPSWSLAVEWVFYLLLPLLVILSLRVGGRAPTRPRRVVAMLVPALILLVIGLIGREWARATISAADPSGVLNTWHAVIDKSFLAWADLFAIGMVLAVLRVEYEDGRLRLPWWWRRTALALCALLTLGLIYAHNHNYLEFHRYNTLIGIPLALLVAAVVLWDGDSRRDPLMRFLEFKPIVRLGDMSLSIYLIHYPVIVVLTGKGIFRSGWDGIVFNTAIVMSIVVALAYVSHRWVELPFMNRKVRTKAPGPPQPEGVGTVAAPAPAPARA